MSPKKSQIEEKDLADDISKILGDQFETLKNQLLGIGFDYLLKGNELTPSEWRQTQNFSFKAFKFEVGKTIKGEQKKLLKSVSVAADMTELKPEQVKSLKTEIKKGMAELGSAIINTQNNNIFNIASKVLKSNVTDSLYTTISDVITKTNDYGVVMYKNGRNVRWENYMEMKVRTDIQNDIADNMVDVGSKDGNIFYVATYHGDCAPDHAPFQGKIYYAKNWKNFCPNELKEEIGKYIEKHNLMTIEDVMGEKGNYFTKRPNCRHYFQYISIEEVLNVKNTDDLTKLRDKYDLNSKGKYKPEKYEALKKQRYNERSIRKIKSKIETTEKIITKLPADTPDWLRTKYANELHVSKLKLKSSQKTQRELIKTNSSVLQRNYNREAYNRMVSNLGVEPLPEIENNSIIKEVGTVKAVASTYSSKLTPLYNAAKQIEPLEGYHDIICHCDGLNFQYENTNDELIEFDVNKMCRYIKKDKTYKGGPIRLVACSSGNELVAQRIADKLGVDVYAPTEDVNFLQVDIGKQVMILGNHYKTHGIESGEWKLFKTNKTKKR